MDLFLLLKLVHVLLAILWVGGAAVLTFVIMVVDRDRNDEATLSAVSHMALAGQRIFGPGSMLTILTGLALAWMGGYGFAAWTVLSAAIVAVTTTLGLTVLGPTSGKCVALWKQGDTAGAARLGRKVMHVVKADLLAQFAIIALMVLKPGWTDPLLLVPAALVALALALGLRAPAPVAAQPA
jgi:uncharacterized membrane protein